MKLLQLVATVATQWGIYAIYRTFIDYTEGEISGIT